MKKILFVLATMLAVTSVQADTVWNYAWYLGGGWAYSPATDNEDAGVLDDYNVTWSLINADTGVQLAGATMTANKQGTLSFSDTGNGGGTGSYLSDLELDSGSGIWYGSDCDGSYNVYQYIYAWNDNDAWEWDNKDNPTWVTAADTTAVPFPSPSRPAEIIIGRSDFAHNTEANTYWKPAEKPSTVPEPATMSLLGLGALAMVLRRKLRK